MAQEPQKKRLDFGSNADHVRVESRVGSGLGGGMCSIDCHFRSLMKYISGHYLSVHFYSFRFITKLIRIKSINYQEKQKSETPLENWLRLTCHSCKRTGSS